MEKQLYTVWKIPKRKGGFRQIESPCDELKKRQKDMLKSLSGVFKVSPFAYAFTYYKNIAVHALPHVGKKWVASMDLSDFFPSITVEKFFKVVLEPLGWKDEERLSFYQTCFHDFKDQKGTRLPQGAPTSPFLSNAYLFKFDWLMARICHKKDCDYTRYADDLVISGEDKKQIAVLLKIAENVLNGRYSLKVNHKKNQDYP